MNLLYLMHLRPNDATDVFDTNDITCCPGSLEVLLIQILQVIIESFDSLFSLYSFPEYCAIPGNTVLYLLNKYLPFKEIFLPRNIESTNQKRTFYGFHPWIWLILKDKTGEGTQIKTYINS